MNPIAHTYFEDPTVQEEQGLSVLETGRTQRPAITVNITHPSSEYVIRLEHEHVEEAETVRGANLLHATVGTAEPVETTASDLAVHATEAFAQLDEPVVIETPVQAPRSFDAEPVTDIAVDDLIQQFEFFEGDETEQPDPADEPEEEPLLTLEELIDDVALTEALADIPVEKRTRVKAARPKRVKTKTRRALPAGWTKTLAVFVGLSFAVVLPIHAVTTVHTVENAQGSILSRGMSALDDIGSGASATAEQDFGSASAAFAQAASSFEEAQDELNHAKTQLFGIADVLPSTSSEIKQAQRLLSAGESLSRSAATLSDGMQTVADRTTESPAAAVNLFDVFVEEALPDLWQAEETLNDVKISSIPVEHRTTVRETQQLVHSVAESMQTFHNSSDALASLLGHRNRQRYLVLFQNNTELRPTGGFWGSFAEIDILDGELVNVTIPGGGTYDVQGQLTENVAAPGPLQLLRARWELQDANWFPDFPTSAQKAMWFYEQSGGPTVDGVIAVNASLVADLIDATGEIHMPSYGITVDGETFLFRTQKQVELDYDQEANQPKSFIGDMAPILLERLVDSDGEAFLDIANTLGEGLNARDIQMYHSDPDIQIAIENLGWDGSVLGNTGDYLMVSHTNIGGGKTDGVIDDAISVESTVRDDGRIENYVTIERTHHGLRSSTFSGLNNVAFTRILVPRGSTLLSVTGAQPPDDHLFESTEGLEEDDDLASIEGAYIDENTGTYVAESFGKTSFGHWMQTSPGTTTALSFRYLLPEDILDEPQETFFSSAKQLVGIPQTVQHSILFQKQPGVDYRTTHYTFDPGSQFRPLWSTDDTVTQMELSNNTDGFFGMVLERR